MKTHLKITTELGDMVWPINRIHLCCQMEDRSTGIPCGYWLIDPEMKMYKITKGEYERVSLVLTGTIKNSMKTQLNEIQKEAIATIFKQLSSVKCIEVKFENNEVIVINRELFTK